MASDEDIAGSIWKANDGGNQPPGFHCYLHLKFEKDVKNFLQFLHGSTMDDSVLFVVQCPACQTCGNGGHATKYCDLRSYKVSDSRSRSRSHDRSKKHSSSSSSSSYAKSKRPSSSSSSSSSSLSSKANRSSKKHHDRSRSPTKKSSSSSFLPSATQIEVDLRVNPNAKVEVAVVVEVIIRIERQRSMTMATEWRRLKPKRSHNPWPFILRCNSPKIN